MKKVAIALVVLLVLAFGLLVGLTNSGLKLFGRSLWTANEDIAQLEELARSFLEDLQYKDFAEAAKYHTFLDQDKVDIPKLIQQLFAVKPETLNIRDFDITRVTVDPDGRRARTFFRANLEFLNTAEGDKPNREKMVEGILYWHKRPGAEGQGVAPDDPNAPRRGARRRGEQAPSTTAVATDGSTAVVDSRTQATPPGDLWFMKLEDSLH